MESLCSSLYDPSQSESTVLLKSKNKSDFLSTRSQRGSMYRGVSKNGEKFQIVVVSGSFKKYIGAIENEHAAGFLYDKYAIIIQGLRVSISLSHLWANLLFYLAKRTQLIPFVLFFKQAKTNFSYTLKSLLELIHLSDIQIHALADNLLAYHNSVNKDQISAPN